MGYSEAKSLAIESWILYAVATLIIICRTYVTTGSFWAYDFVQATELTCF